MPGNNGVLHCFVFKLRSSLLGQIPDTHAGADAVLSVLWLILSPREKKGGAPSLESL